VVERSAAMSGKDGIGEVGLPCAICGCTNGIMDGKGETRGVTGNSFFNRKASTCRLLLVLFVGSDIVDGKYKQRIGLQAATMPSF
jgi:hypothetical protein